METVELIALILVLVGGVNWGLVGILDLDLVAAIFGKMTVLSKLVYSLVGLSALYLTYLKITKK
jgi:hypothetical protein